MWRCNLHWCQKRVSSLHAVSPFALQPGRAAWEPTWLCCRYLLMQSSSGIISEIASTGKAAQACITEVSKNELLISQDTSSLFLGKIVCLYSCCDLHRLLVLCYAPHLVRHIQTTLPFARPCLPHGTQKHGCTCICCRWQCKAVQKTQHHME